MTFLAKILPTQGLYCVAMALKPQGFRHFFYGTVEQAQAQIDALDAQGHTVYMAQASFATPENRKQTNAQCLRNFFLDIDCGEGKDYPDQKTAVAALKSFVAEAQLPFPAVVSSGNGLYAHWPIIEDIPAEQWQSVARLFKNICAAYEFKTDPARTSDAASVLRPPGAHNRKREIKRVALLKDADPIRFMTFVRHLHVAGKARKVNLAPLAKPKTQDINADFYANDERRVEAQRLREKCLQVRRFADLEGNVSEPLWYSMIGLLSFSEESDAEADELIHSWSSGHPEYSPAATEAKINQFRASGTGPTTCAHFGMLHPEGCTACKHVNKIKSPIVLGRPEPEAKEIEPNSDECAPPDGFRRAEGGLYYEEDGQWKRFYDCDLYPVRIARDAALGYETTTLRHFLPHEGWEEFTLRSSSIHDPKTIHTLLADAHVKIVGKKEKRAMEIYLEGYVQKLQRQRRMSQMLCQMGWKADRDGTPMFVLGRKVFYADGRVDDAPLSRGVPQAAEGFRSEGSLEEWVAATRYLQGPGMEPYAFALLCGFGAPLMKFTGFEGAVVALEGASGIGKTLMLRFAQSIYGKHTDLIMLREDTKNALISRLGVYGTLPLAIDEVTNIDGMDLSDLVYRITQGRDKARLTKNAEEKRNTNTWNTIALVSTNSSLIDRLGGLKHDATAEINRILEYKMQEHPAFGSKETGAVYWALDRNFGHAGEKFIAWLVANHAKVAPSLELVRQKIDGDAKIRGEERFWSAVASAAIYGGLVAKQLGLIEFDVVRVMTWVGKMIRDLRGEKVDLTGSGVDALGQFLDEHANNRLLVKGDCGHGKPAIPIDTPRGALVVRHEIDNNRLYISRQTFKNWLAKRYGSYSKVVQELKECGALKNTNYRKVLGAGTSYGGAQQTCWAIDLNCRALGSVGLTLVQEAEMLERGVRK